MSNKNVLHTFVAIFLDDFCICNSIELKQKLIKYLVVQVITRIKSRKMKLIREKKSKSSKKL